MSLEILIVEDDLVSVLIHKNIIRLCKIDSEVVSCLDGQEALKYLDEEFKEDSHYLIMLDISMPVMDGWDFLKLLQTRIYKHNVTIVILTSSVNKKDQKRAFTFSQVAYYIEKPLTLETCKQLKTLEVVREYLHGS